MQTLQPLSAAALLDKAKRIFHFLTLRFGTDSYVVSTWICYLGDSVSQCAAIMQGREFGVAEPYATERRIGVVGVLPLIISYLAATRWRWRADCKSASIVENEKVRCDR